MTFQKNAENDSKSKTEEYAQIKDKHQRLFDIPQILIMIFKSDSTIVRVSAGWKDILGYSPSDMVGKSFFDFIHPNDLSVLEAQSKNAVHGKLIQYLDNRYRHKNGSYHTLSWSVSVDPSNDVYYGLAQDITKR